MNVTRRTLLKNLAAAPAVLAVSRFAQAADAKVIKISHQFPGGSIDKGDFRDRLTRKLADEDGGAVLRAAPRRARHEPVPARLRRRRSAGAEHRAHAVHGDLVRAGLRLEEGRGGPR